MSLYLENVFRTNVDMSYFPGFGCGELAPEI